MNNSPWPMVALEEVLSLNIDAVPIDPLQTYRIAGVYSFARGLLKREPLLGSNTTYKVFHRLHKDDFVISQPKAWEGALARITSEFEGWFLSPVFPTFRAISDRLDIRYLEWYCRQAKVWNQLKNKARGIGARRESVLPKQFLSLQIPLPPLAEQRRLVARIETLAAKVEAARTLREQATADAKGLIYAQTRKILASVTARATKLQNWLNVDRAGIQTGPFGAQLSSREFMSSGVPVLTIGNVQFDGLKLDVLKYVSEEKAKQLERFALEKGDILFARMGTVGRCCVVPQEAKGWLINYHIIRVALDTSKVEPRFIHWTIQASADVEAYLGENIRGATRQGVNSKIVGGLPCRIPPLPEQRRIVAHLDALQAKLALVQQHQAATQARLEALLPSILDQAFKGEL